MAELTFNIAEGTLRGAFGEGAIEGFAISGGRGGTTTPGAGSWLLQNNVLSTRVKEEEAGVGGTIPLGEYRMTPHEAKLAWTRLAPIKDTYTGRTGLAIHPRGPVGSQGCLVPWTAGDAQKIRHMVENHHANTHTWPILEVIAVGDIDFKANMA